MADLSTGGLSLGAGMLIGALLGALGGGGAARAYNLMQGQDDGRLRWSSDFFLQHVRASLLRYLAVAHFGRGRGEWVEGEAPPHWLPLVDKVVVARQAALDVAWRTAEEGDLTVRLQAELTDAARELLVRLYPEASELLHDRHETVTPTE